MKSSKPAKAQRKGHSPAPSKARPGMLPWVVLALSVAGVIGFLAWKNQPRRWDSSPLFSSTEPTILTNATRSASDSVADFQKLKGQWVRPDGGYIIDIKQVAEGGRLEAAYFNPKPINVAQAQASQEGTATKVFVELRDANYPGSTYTLTYLPGKDLLVGIYYQALQQQSFEVYFERMK